MLEMRLLCAPLTLAVAFFAKSARPARSLLPPPPPPADKGGMRADRAEVGLIGPLAGGAMGEQKITTLYGE